VIVSPAPNGSYAIRTYFENDASYEQGSTYLSKDLTEFHEKTRIGSLGASDLGDFILEFIRCGADDRLTDSFQLAAQRTFCWFGC
jgi:hypothetical protein